MRTVTPVEDSVDRWVAVVAFVIYLPIGGFLTALMGSWLWNMVLPELFGVRRIGIVDAFGVALVFDFFAYQYRPDTNREKRRLLDTVSSAIGASLAVKSMFLLMGLVYAWLS